LNALLPAPGSLPFLLLNLTQHAGFPQPLPPSRASGPHDSSRPIIPSPAKVIQISILNRIYCYSLISSSLFLGIGRDTVLIISSLLNA
jgi:hypothetical protein